MFRSEGSVSTESDRDWSNELSEKIKVMTPKQGPPYRQRLQIKIRNWYLYVTTVGATQGKTWFAVRLLYLV